MKNRALLCGISALIMLSSRLLISGAPSSVNVRNIRQANLLPCAQYIANPDWSFNPQSWSRYGRSMAPPVSSGEPCLTIDQQKQMPVDEVNSNAAIAYGIMGAGLMQAGVPGR